MSAADCLTGRSSTGLGKRASRDDRRASSGWTFRPPQVNIAGYAADLYGHPWWFDEAVHGYTGGALTLWLGLLLYGRVLTGAQRHRVWLILVIIAVGLGAGAFWELGEWAYDGVTPGNVIKGKHDTMIDLCADGIGATVAACVVSITADDRSTSGDNDG